MIGLDWIILAVLGIGFIVGFIRGIIRQAFSLGGLILGIICGTLLYKPFAGLLLNVFNMSDKTAGIVAFVVILLVVPIICGLLGKMLSKLVHAADLGFVDCLIGAFFGMFKYILVMGLVIKLLDITGIMGNIVSESDREESKLYAPVCNFTGFCLQWTWNKVQETAVDLVPEIPESDGEDNDKVEPKKV